MRFDGTIKTSKPGARKRGRAGSRAPSRRGPAFRFAIPAFLLLCLVAALLWQSPAWVAGLYLGASGLAIALYAIDKSAAVAGASRVAESTLLLVGLAGGWPGAIIAQQWLRHKSSKASFRAAFSITVAANLVALFTLATPLATWLRALSAAPRP